MTEAPYPCWIADETKKDLNIIVHRLTNAKKKKDAVLIYTGEEGSGKTTLSMQHAAYIAKQCGTTFTINNIFFTPESLYDAVMKDNNPPGTVFIYDEGVSGLLGTLANSKEGRKLHMMFTTCRSKRYAILICIPRFYEIPYWMAVDRCMLMYKTFEHDLDDNLDGTNMYVGYNKVGKSIYWSMLKRKRFGMARKVITTRAEKFTAWPFGGKMVHMPFTEQEYEQRKRESLASTGKLVGKDKLLIVCMEILRDKGMSFSEISIKSGLETSSGARIYKGLKASAAASF